MQQENSQNKLAVLIDADNTQPSIIDALLAEIAKYGIASVRRIYGDWTTPNLRGWKGVLLEQAIQPIQQFRYTVGKNATDSALIIDAMDLRAFGVGPRTWINVLQRDTKDRILIGCKAMNGRSTSNSSSRRSSQRKLRTRDCSL